MRWLASVAAAGLVVLAGAANAGPFAGGQLHVQLGDLPGLAVPISPGAGVATVGPSGTVVLSTASVLLGTDSFTGFTPVVTRVRLRLSGNDTGTLAPGAGTLANVLGLSGALDLLGYGGLVTISTIPLSPVGVPGAFASRAEPGGFRASLTGAGWTTGPVTVSVPGTTLSGAAQVSGTVLAAGTNQMAGGVGQVTYVSPTLVRTNLRGDLPTVVSLGLVFVPEPGTLVLLGSGVLGLSVLGRLRTRG